MTFLTLHLYGELTPAQALTQLKEGNQRYINDATIHGDYSHIIREATVLKQKPFAAIVGCSDSRVPPEIVFDQTVGDIFVVRVAGNVVGPVELDSIDYSVAFLGAKVVVVLGHQNCGAVDAVLQGQTKDIESVAELLRPSLTDKDKKKLSLEDAIKLNVKHVTEQLRDAPVLRARIEKNELLVVGGYYSLESGKVEFILD